MNALYTSPLKTREDVPQDDRSVASRTSTTQATRRDQGGEEECTPSVPSDSFSKAKTEREYELKAWPRKSGRFKSVVDTVRSLRSRTVHSAPASFSGAENISGPEESAGQGSQVEERDKPRKPSSASKVNSIRKKFSFLKDRRQRSVSESHLSVLYSSQDDMNGMAANGSKNRAMKKLMRRSSENVTGSTTLSGRKSPEKSFHSLPNSPITATSSKDRFEAFVGQRNSRSTASYISNSPGSSTTQEKCPACDFNVLILNECPDCEASQQEGLNSTFKERLIL